MSARTSGTWGLAVVILLTWTTARANAAASGWEASALSHVPTRSVPAGFDGTLSRDNHIHALQGGWGRDPVASRASLPQDYDIARALSDSSGCFYFTLDMTDSWGDGWGNFVYMLADAQGNLEYSGTLASGSSTTQDWCLEPNYYIFSIPDSDPNGWGSEVGYSFCGISGGGVGGEETIVVNSDGTCECDLPESPLPPPH